MFGVREAPAAGKIPSKKLAVLAHKMEKGFPVRPPRCPTSTISSRSLGWSCRAIGSSGCFWGAWIGAPKKESGGLGGDNLSTGFWVTHRALTRSANSKHMRSALFVFVALRWMVGAHAAGRI